MAECLFSLSESGEELTKALNSFNEILLNGQINEIIPLYGLSEIVNVLIVSLSNSISEQVDLSLSIILTFMRRIPTSCRFFMVSGFSDALSVKGLLSTQSTQTIISIYEQIINYNKSNIPHI